MFAEIFKESDRVHTFPVVAMPQQREEWTHQNRNAVVTEAEDRDSDDKDSVMTLLIYPEEYNDKDPPSNPPYVDPTPEPIPPSKKTTKETTLGPDYDTL